MRIPTFLRAVSVIAIAMAATSVFAQKQPHTFLKTVGGFTDKDLATLDGGAVISTTLDSGVDNELAFMGAVRIKGTIETFLEHYRDIETFEAALGTAKKLSDPPTMSDLQGLEFEKGDLKALRNCKVGDCAIKLDEETLEELQSQIDWSAPDAGAAVVRFIHERVLEYANAYEKGGNAELAVYRNKSKPQYVAKEFEALLDNSPYVLQYRPELHKYLTDYPKATLEGASDFLYWSIINFGPKPTLRLNHVTIYPTEKGKNGATIITSKQLYYSRYFDTGFELYTLVPDAARPDNGFYLVTVNRYRTDLGGGLTGKVMRLGAAVGTKSAMEDTIAAAQAAVQK
jgi:hypothetical protein